MLSSFMGWCYSLRSVISWAGYLVGLNHQQAPTAAVLLCSAMGLQLLQHVHIPYPLDTAAAVAVLFCQCRVLAVG